MSWSPLDCSVVAPLEYEGGVMVDPASGFEIPKEAGRHASWRAAVLGRAEVDEKARLQVIRACRSSVVFAVNLLFHVRCEWVYGEDGGKREPEMPVMAVRTWPCQDRELLRVDRCYLEGKPFVGLKSREMGWTWLMTWYDCWRAIFFEKYSVTVASEKEDRVDRGGDPNTIFAKFRMNLRAWDGVSGLPGWLVPRGVKSGHMQLEVLHNGSTVFGEATTGNIARGGRNQRVWVDEARTVDNLADVEASLRHASKSRAYISTPWPGSYFNELCADAAFEQARMFWYEHPEKGAGRVRADVGDFTPYRNRWFDREERESSRSVLLSEVCATLEGAGSQVFDPMLLERLKIESCVEPDLMGNVVIVPGMVPNTLHAADGVLIGKRVEGVVWDSLQMPKRWRLWCGLMKDRGGRLRPDQDEAYAFGVDVGGGLGRSNSAISVMRKSDGVKVGEFASPEYEPFDLARIVVGAALWFGGRSNPVVCWEKNGPGESLGLHLHERLRYWPLWLREPVNDMASVPGSKLGWHSTSATKPILLNEYAAALSRGDFVNRSFRAIEEARGFVYARGGRITHKLRADLESGASDAHGDVTIADALAWLALSGVAMVVKAVKRDGRRFRRTMEGMKALQESEAEPAGTPDWRTI